jgi:outer membrane protein assembly factor BamB
MGRLAALALLTVSLSPVALVADEWPMFRGRAAGVGADDPALPDSWSATENVAWKAAIPGLGWSSPVV